MDESLRTCSNKIVAHADAVHSPVIYSGRENEKGGGREDMNFFFFILSYFGVVEFLDINVRAAVVQVNIKC